MQALYGELFDGILRSSPSVVDDSRVHAFCKTTPAILGRRLGLAIARANSLAIPQNVRELFEPLFRKRELYTIGEKGIRGSEDIVVNACIHAFRIRFDVKFQVNRCSVNEGQLLGILLQLIECVCEGTSLYVRLWNILRKNVGSKTFATPSCQNWCDSFLFHISHREHDIFAKQAAQKAVNENQCLRAAVDRIRQWATVTPAQRSTLEGIFSDDVSADSWLDTAFWDEASELLVNNVANPIKETIPPIVSILPSTPKKRKDPPTKPLEYAKYDSVRRVYSIQLSPHNRVRLGPLFDVPRDKLECAESLEESLAPVENPKRRKDSCLLIE